MAISAERSELDFVGYYLGQTWLEMRHVETLRVGFATTIATVALAASGFVLTSDKPQPLAVLLVSVFLEVLGVVGLLGTSKFTQMYDWDQARVDAWHDYWDSLIPSSRVLAVRDAADAEFWSSRSKRLRHRHIWMALSSAPILLGVILIIWSSTLR